MHHAQEERNKVKNDGVTSNDVTEQVLHEFHVKWDYLYSPVMTECEMLEPDLIDSNSYTMESVQMILTRSLQVCYSQP